MNQAQAYFAVFITVFATAYGQLIIKWQINKLDFPIANDINSKMNILSYLLLNPWIISSFIAAFIAALSWMLAMTKLELSRAYPMTALTLVFVSICGSVVFSEIITASKIVGIFFIIIGVCVLGI